MSQRVLIAVMLGLAAFAVAGNHQTVEELKERLNEGGGNQAELCTRIAEHQIDALDKAYSAGDVQQARAALADVVTYGLRAAKSARESGKRMKQTEIALRKMSLRLEAIRKSLDTEDRPPVADAVEKLETARSELLNRIFKR